MSFDHCLAAAVSEKAITSRQAEELKKYYEARFKKKRPGMTDAEARAAARDEVAAQLRQEAREAKRQTLLAEARRKEANAFIDGYRDRTGKENKLDAALSMLIHYGNKGGRSMEGRAMAIVSMAHRDLAEAMHHFRRTKLSGRHRNRADLPDLIRELNSETSGNEVAKGFAKAIRNVMEDLRQRFNAAGGNIAKREDFDLPHSHDRLKLRNLGAIGRDWRKAGLVPKIDIEKARTRWKAFIRPLLDVDRMIHPKSGDIVGADGIDEALDYSFASIVSDGWAHRRPEARKFGMGKLASRYQDQRFLIFRDAESWLTYNKAFGQADPIATIFNHINGLSRDIAAMETFGPNPDAAIEWIKQAVQADIGKQLAGLKGVAKLPGMSAGKWAEYRIDSLWRALRGGDPVLDAAAQWTGDIRNIATSAMLGSTSILAAVTDPFVAAASRRLAGLPVTASLHKLIGKMVSDGDKRAMARRAVIWDDYLHTLNEQARFVDQMFGHEWSRYLVDRSLTFNALKPLTEARKRVEAAAWHDTLGGYAEKDTDWLDLPPLLKKAMEGFGFTDTMWHEMRKGVDAAGFLDPGGVYQKTGNRELGERYAEMIHMWGERSVPSGDPRIKSVITGQVPRGTVLGEIAAFGTQFMSFGMSFTARQMEAIYIYSMLARSTPGRVARGGWYFASMAIPLTVGAAFYTQVLNVLNGKDPEDMTASTFWAKAFVKGGGGGLFADFIDKAENRYGQSMMATLGGPGGSFVADTFSATLATIQDIVGIGEGKAGRKVANYVGRYTPVLSSHPFTRAAYRRMFVDQLQWAIDPDADASFKAQKRKSSFWWQPGEMTPRRAPNLDVR